MKLIVGCYEVAQNSKTAGDSPLEVRSHAEIGINKNFDVSHSRRRVMASAPSADLVDADDEYWYSRAAPSCWCSTGGG